MNATQFELAVKSVRLDSASQTWFPRWRSRYASFLQAPDDAVRPVDRERVIAFLRMLRDRTVPARQRLQAAVKADTQQFPWSVVDISASRSNGNC